MKKLIACLLCIALVCSAFSGCAAGGNDPSAEPAQIETVAPSAETEETAAETLQQTAIDWSQEVKFTGMSDPALTRYIEDTAYISLVAGLNSDKYFVEKVEAVYVSQEYLEELEYNSQSNVFFGYALADLDSIFEGTRYVFTLGEDGTTTVEPLEIIEDTTTEQILKNVAVGTGVILLCVTVSAVSGGLGAPAVCSIFAVAAKTGTVCALSGTALGGFSAGLVKWIETGDWDETLKAGTLGASEGYKWGAITGAVSGAAKETWGLYSISHASRVRVEGTDKPFLTMNDVAEIQRESLYPLDVIKQLQSKEQYDLLKEAGLQTQMVGGKLALVPPDGEIDLSYLDKEGLSNLERMLKGDAPLDASGTAYELHHIGQRNDATLVAWTRSQHRGKGANAINHLFKTSEVDHGAAWQSITLQFWKNMAAILSAG